ncbi:conserved unknown protein [Ectocarpus siliculosus]|uniref:Inositol polyphosphate-related phosphatase domain-containing protein n=1 Tax=Ectocarpus siliculosus TaxID=2880 RepID=D8LL08_ECTSI|nr:conserved unknown protein [Ectocarpus siliculosus]|eukprot:CBN80141.1 conserved unknown protein [Ectocarpus siliculosus]
MDISPPRSLAPRPEEDDSDGRKSRDPAATASAREISAVGASDKDSGDDSSSPTKRGDMSAAGTSDMDSGDDSSSPTKREEMPAAGTSDKDNGDDNSGPTKQEEVSAVGASDKDSCDDSSSPTKREEMSAVGTSDKDSGDDNSGPTKPEEVSAVGDSGKDSSDDNGGPTKPEEVSAVGDSDKDSGDGSSSSTKREDMLDVGASGKDSGDDNSGPTKREDMSDVGDSDKDSGGDSESPIKPPAEVRVEAADVLDLRVFCGTWNVAGRKLDSAEDMGLWLDVDKLDEEGDTSVPPDVFVIGFQEVVELSAQNVVMDSFLDTQSRTNSLQWFTHVYAYLAQYGERYGVRYAMVTEQRLLGTYMLIMAKEDLCPKIAHVQTAVVPTGLGGYLGNKGAVAVRLEVGGRSSLCFVCVHMAAHREHVLARNAEYKLISSKPVFADTDGRLPVDEAEDPAGKDQEKDKAQDRWQGSTWGSLFGAAGQGGRSGGMSPTRNSEVKKAIRAAMAFGLPKRGGGGEGRASSGKGDIDGSGSEAEKGARPAEDVEVDDFAWMPSDEGMSAGLPKTKTVLQADVVFWIGDLNYRITEETPDQEVFEMLQNDDLETLSGLDQLTIARASGTAFQEFQEGPLCFPPSYKYIPGTKEYDQRPEKKVRCPSWCDRVLYAMGMQGGDSVRRLGLERYWSSGPLVSDHMPGEEVAQSSFHGVPGRAEVATKGHLSRCTCQAGLLSGTHVGLA